MGLWVPLELCVDFLRKNQLWAKMTKMVKNAPKMGFFQLFLKLLSLVFA